MNRRPQIIKSGVHEIFNRDKPAPSKKQKLLDERRRLMRRLKEIEREMKEAVG